MATAAGVLPVGINATAGSGATTGAAQTLPQAMAFMPPSPGWSGQSWQSPWSNVAISDIIAILAAMPLAWATERPIPAATKVARRKMTRSLVNEFFIGRDRIAPNLCEYKLRYGSPEASAVNSALFNAPDASAEEQIFDKRRNHQHDHYRSDDARKTHAPHHAAAHHIVDHGHLPSSGHFPVAAAAMMQKISTDLLTLPLLEAPP